MWTIWWPTSKRRSLTNRLRRGASEREAGEGDAFASAAGSGKYGIITREEAAKAAAFFPFFKEYTMFEMLLREMTLLMAQVHGMLMRINDGFELRLGDKDWHFIVMAIVAMLMFFVVHAVFKRLARWSITAVSFIYVFTVMAVLGFAIEIGQKITGTGNMDFADIVAGLYGVLAFFAVYSVYRLAAYTLCRLFGKRK